MSGDDKTIKLSTNVDELTINELTLQELTQLVRLIYSELQSLGQKVDARLHDTRPIWEAVQSQLSQLSESVSDINHKITLLHGDVLQVRTDQRKANQRIDSLEKQPA